jgi:hypothetical protein
MTGPTGFGMWSQHEDAGPPPRNHMAWAILSLVLCCLPLGIVSVVYASRVNGQWAAGDHVGAAESATRARQWAWAALFAGLFLDALLGAALFETQRLGGG